MQLKKTKAGGVMRYKIGITIGDPAGIGSEIVLKALSDKRIYERCIPVVIGDLDAINKAMEFAPDILGINWIRTPAEAQGHFGVVDFIDLGILEGHKWEYGKVQQICGEASFQYITTAIDFAMKGELHGIATAPINKEALSLSGHESSGQTAVFAKYTNTKNYNMLLIAPDLRVMHVTTHLALNEACEKVRSQPKLVERTIMMANDAMHLIGFESPRIAVTGLNPHASENGLFGDAEAVSIVPAIEKCKANGLNIDGPLSADTAFVKAVGGAYDVVVAMYHDQGHIPLMLRSFRDNEQTGKFSLSSSVNMNVGLPIIRTSVIHGTAFSVAGKGVANEKSLVEAILLATDVASVKFKD